MWTIEGNSLVAHRVNIGMTDGTNTELLSGMKLGAEVITGINVASPDDEAAADGSSEKSPFAPGPPGKNKKK